MHVIVFLVNLREISNIEILCRRYKQFSLLRVVFITPVWIGRVLNLSYLILMVRVCLVCNVVSSNKLHAMVAPRIVANDKSFFHFLDHGGKISIEHWKIFCIIDVLVSENASLKMFGLEINLVRTSRILFLKYKASNQLLSGCCSVTLDYNLNFEELVELYLCPSAGAPICKCKVAGVHHLLLN